MTLEEIRQKSPNVQGFGGGKWVMYSMRCTWWTTFPDDLGRRDGAYPIPCCPHCKCVLLQAPLKEFLRVAESNPSYYGTGGLDTLAAAHSRNASTCHATWAEYEAAR